MGVHSNVPPTFFLGEYTMQSKMRVQERIDWLSLTFSTHHTYTAILPEILQGSMERIKSPIPVYKDCYELPFGAKLLTNGGDRLGQHLILSGKPLAKIRGEDANFMAEMYDVFTSTNANISRIDIAVDVFDCDDFTVDMVSKRLEANPDATKLQGQKFIATDSGIETLYIGNPKSKARKLRVYDKRLETGSNFCDKWIRVEYEKRKGAKNLYRKVMETGNIRAIMKSVIDFPAWEAWRDIMGVEIDTVGRGQELEKDYSRIDWIIKSALPAIAKEIKQSASEYETSYEDAPATRIINNVLTRLLNGQ